MIRSVKYNQDKLFDFSGIRSKCQHWQLVSRKSAVFNQRKSIQFKKGSFKAWTLKSDNSWIKKNGFHIFKITRLLPLCENTQQIFVPWHDTLQLIDHPATPFAIKVGVGKLCPFSDNYFAGKFVHAFVTSPLTVHCSVFLPVRPRNWNSIQNSAAHSRIPVMRVKVLH